MVSVLNTWSGIKCLLYVPAVKKCQLCDFITSSLSFLLKHLTLIHSNDPGFLIQCSLNGCSHTYTNIRTYKNHVYALHSSSHSSTVPSFSAPLDEEADGSEDLSDTFFENLWDDGECDDDDGGKDIYI